MMKKRIRVFDHPPRVEEIEDTIRAFGHVDRIVLSSSTHKHLSLAEPFGYSVFLQRRNPGSKHMPGLADFFIELERDIWAAPITDRERELLDASGLSMPQSFSDVAPPLHEVTVDRKTAAGKLMMHLVTSHLTRQAAAADTYGAEKYQEPGSWRNAPVEDVYRYVDAAERHLSDVKAALVEGKVDRWLAPDSKLAHLAHLAATVGILIEFAERMFSGG